MKGRHGSVATFASSSYYDFCSDSNGSTIATMMNDAIHIPNTPSGEAQ